MSDLNIKASTPVHHINEDSFTQNCDIIDPSNILIKHPFCMTVAGPSQCGKTYFVTKLLQNYDVWSSIQNLKKFLESQIPIIEFRKGLLDDFYYVHDTLVVLDDLLTEWIDNKDALHLFTRGSHHRNISVIFLTQNIFQQGKYARSKSLNSHYLVMFNNLR